MLDLLEEIEANFLDTQRSLDPADERPSEIRVLAGEKKDVKEVAHFAGLGTQTPLMKDISLNGDKCRLHGD